VAPVVLTNVPGSQNSQVLAATPLEYEPGAHCWHDDWPALPWNDPCVHCSQLELPLMAL